MEHDISAAQNRSDLVVTADIDAGQLDRGRNLLQILLAPAEEIVDHDHFSSALPQQAAHQGGADEPGAARDYESAHVGSSAIRASR